MFRHRGVIVILAYLGVPGPVQIWVPGTPDPWIQGSRDPWTLGPRTPGTSQGPHFGTWVFEGPEQVWAKPFKTPMEPHLDLTVLPKPVKRCPKMVKKWSFWDPQNDHFLTGPGQKGTLFLNRFWPVYKPVVGVFEPKTCPFLGVILSHGWSKRGHFRPLLGQK